MSRGRLVFVSIGASLFLIGLGAILRYAVTASVSGVSIGTVGLILMIVGGIGLIISVFWMVMSTDRRPTPREDEVPPRTRVRDPRDRYY